MNCSPSWAARRQMTLSLSELPEHLWNPVRMRGRAEGHGFTDDFNFSREPNTGPASALAITAIELMLTLYRTEHLRPEMISELNHTTFKNYHSFLDKWQTSEGKAKFTSSSAIDAFVSGGLDAVEVYSNTVAPEDPDEAQDREITFYRSALSTVLRMLDALDTEFVTNQLVDDAGSWPRP